MAISRGARGRRRGHSKARQALITAWEFRQHAAAYDVEVAGFDGRRMECIRSLAARAMATFAAKGGYLPKRIVVDAERFAELKRGPYVEVLALYESDTATVFLNAASCFFAPGESAAREYAAWQKEWRNWSTGAVEHLLWHEFAHAEHHHAVANQYLVQLSSPVWAEEVQLLALAEVSECAAEDPNEFVAEVRAGLVGGERYSARVMAWYSYFGGQQ